MPLAALASLFFAVATSAAPRAAPRGQSFPVTVGSPVRPAVFRGDVRQLPAITPKPISRRRPAVPRTPKTGTTAAAAAAVAPAAAAPGPRQTFAGLSYAESCGGSQCGTGYPADPVGDVGPGDYVEAVNTSIGIFRKDGTSLAAVTLDALWASAATGTPCDSMHQGDPIVLYDPLADRWIVGDLAFATDDQDTPVPPFEECLAVSQSGDPVAGGWYFYPVRTDDATHPDYPDYPKLGVWPDGIYLTANLFDPTRIDPVTQGNPFVEARVWAFDRAALEAGQPLQAVTIDTSASQYSMLPSNLRGAPPPSGIPNYVVAEDLRTYDYDVYAFHIDWTTPASSTFLGPVQVSQQVYSLPPAGVPQPNTAQLLDSLQDRLMMQAQYRNLGGRESLWVAHTVGLGGNANVTGVQWAQIDVTGGMIQPAPAQEQVWSNGGDGIWRWVPSLAVDRSGDVAIGYSASSSAAVYPSIRYAGRLGTDPAGSLAQGEATLFAGSGAQTFSERWGDYSAMTVDPVDDCTFWYVNEYYDVSGSQSWQTRVGSFAFPGCATPTPSPTGTATPTPTPSASASATRTPSTTRTATSTHSTTATSTGTPSAAGTAARTPTSTATSGRSPTATATPTPPSADDPTETRVPYRVFLPRVLDGP